MNPRRRPAAIFGVLALLALLGTACQQTASSGPSSSTSILERVLSEHVLKVGVIDGNPPYSQLGANGQPSGYDIDIATKIAETLGAKPQFTTVDIAGRVTSLQTRQLELVVADFTRTPKRAETIDFSAPYLVVRGQFLVSAKRSDLNTRDDLNKPSVRIAITRGGTAETNVPAAAPNAKIVAFNNEGDTVQALNSGQVDAISQDNLFNAQIIKDHPGQYKAIPGYFSAENISLGLPQNDLRWQRWLDIWVSEFNDSGANNLLFTKYFGFPLPPVGSGE